LSNYLTGFLRVYYPDYLSATEVNILRLLAPTAAETNTQLIFKVLDSSMVEESTNETYGHILSNLTYIATFASGILVNKDLVYSVDPATEYLRPATSLVQDAHAANLTVFVYDFANDNYPSSYNYSYDSVREYLGYLGDNFTVDGFLTDFPTTAAEAIRKIKTISPDTFVIEK
jgi:glycerophosphoryl diester phosphodiesterase